MSTCNFLRLASHVGSGVGAGVGGGVVGGGGGGGGAAPAHEYPSAATLYWFEMAAL